MPVVARLVGHESQRSAVESRVKPLKKQKKVIAISNTTWEFKNIKVVISQA